MYCKKVDFYNSGTFFRVAFLLVRSVCEYVYQMKNDFEDSVLLGYGTVSSQENGILTCTTAETSKPLRMIL
jgi:hypothetical protein